MRSHAKISAVCGGFAAVLDAGDLFGRALAPLADLDGDGITDLAIAAEANDDANNDRGGVWIAFLNGAAALYGNAVQDPGDECDDGGTAGATVPRWRF